MIPLYKNVHKFNADIDKFVKGLVPQQCIKLHKKLGLLALRDLVMMTPVDTGRARGNWQVTIGNPAINATENTDKRGMDTIAAGVATIENLQAYQAIYISNNVPYIMYLEEGTSKQAPNGMMKRTVIHLRSVFK